MPRRKTGHRHLGSNQKIHAVLKEVSAETGDLLELTWIDKLKRRQILIGSFLCVRKAGRKELSLILVQRLIDEVIPTRCYCIPMELVHQLRVSSKKHRKVKWKRVEGIFNDAWKRIPKKWMTAALEFHNMVYGQTRAKKMVTRYLAFNLDTGESLVIGDLEKTEWTKIPRIAYKEYMYLPKPTLERLRALIMKIQDAELKKGKPAKISESKVKHLATIYGLNQLEKMPEAQILELIDRLPD